MRTAISEFDTATAESAPVTGVPRRSAGGPRSAAYACLAGAQSPRSRQPEAAPVRMAGRPRGLDAAARVERAQLGLATLAAAALLSAAAVAGLIALAQIRSGEPNDAHTALVQVAEGESLADVAQRVDPADPVHDVVQQIVQLNGLRGAEVSPGRTLVVPVRTGRQHAR
ncbi:LysM peptidoglycan-binding domain-containing protein [Nocardia sp. alder85J]|uniref:LysM peptidoglycan-binding domain-containing protein n=1 Tax=Nocardia sp. alder85J TaxID=2862949 RepID=UPI001CD4FB63|nr:LysM peptidoglycan-binding domain-containing protein [Nocardia sp. alder85J]MCX4094907.1 LysM peptidoglycan-binding domain-containing protein [Nocardia sp. alder85J]